MRKRVNLIAIFSIILIFVIVAVSLFIILGNKTSDNNEILNCSTITEVKEYIENNDIASYGFDSNYCHISDVSVMDLIADVEFLFKDEATAQITVFYDLFQKIDEDASQEELESFDVMTYKFTENDKKEIVNSFNKVKQNAENKFGCKFEKYDLIPTQEGLEIDNDENKFYEGLFVREYSVRDSYGMLWLLRFEASYGMARATLIKVVDDSGYEGFIPIVDMTKE